MTLKQLFRPKGKMRVAAFMSGTGSNLGKILEKQSSSNYEVAMIFSDTKDESKCNAKKIAEEHKIAYYCNDIKDYYSRRGYSDRKNMEARKEYDRETAKLLEKNKVDAVALCGYMSIVTEEICSKFLTLNVHPADLRILDAGGKRKYAGCMGAGCVRKAIEDNGKELRSSTHIVTAEVDNGPVLMVSNAVTIDSSNDEELLGKLKEQGDWKIYPETLKRLSEGRFWIDEEEGIAIDIVEEKQMLREKMRELRDKLSDEEVAKRSAAIQERIMQLKAYESAKTVMLYMGINKEVHTGEAIRNAMKEKEVAVPVTDTENSRIIAAKLSGPEKMKPGAYGIPEPMEIEEINPGKIDIVFVPGLAFDSEGNRIGYGLGYYDKFLKKTKAKKIGLAYEMQVVDKIRADEKDARMDAIITEERTIEVSA